MSAGLFPSSCNHLWCYCCWCWCCWCCHWFLSAAVDVDSSLILLWFLSDVQLTVCHQAPLSNYCITSNSDAAIDSCLLPMSLPACSAALHLCCSAALARVANINSSSVNLTGVNAALATITTNSRHPLLCDWIENSFSPVSLWHMIFIHLLPSPM